jgi:hypothetical protein
MRSSSHKGPFMSDRPPAYFAYGSNLHPLRLGLRTPSCRLLGTAALHGWRLEFHKRSDADGSAKADVVRTDDPGDCVWGVVYALDPAEFPLLDRVEGPGYAVRETTLVVAGETLPVFFYQALGGHTEPALQPWSWYRDLIHHGAAWHRFPETYVNRIRAVVARPDPDRRRAASHERMIAAMADWLPEHGYWLP